MDGRIDPGHISDVLQQFDRQKKSDEYSADSSNAREVVSAIGTDTPVTILLDIRHILAEINTAIRDQNRRNDDIMQHILESNKRQQESDDQKHLEMLAFMNKMSESSGRAYVQQPSSMSSQMKSLSIADSDGRYYYKGDEIKTNQAVIACFLVHLDILVSKTLPMSSDITDTSIMELKDWSSAVTILREVESSNTPNPGVLSLPKKNSEECLSALDVIASTVPGRTVTCKSDHIHALMVACPTIASCVEEIRLRALACPGVIGSSKLRRLSAISFPYVLKDGILNIVNQSPKTVGSIILHEKVRQMNAHQKKIYAHLILRDGKKPIAASAIATEQSKIDFKKWKDSQH